MTPIPPGTTPREITARIHAVIAAQAPDGAAPVAAYEAIPVWTPGKTSRLRAIEAWKRQHSALLKEARSWPA